jgi:hypothetical protein
MTRVRYLELLCPYGPLLFLGTAALVVGLGSWWDGGDAV